MNSVLVQFVVIIRGNQLLGLATKGSDLNGFLSASSKSFVTVERGMNIIVLIL